MSSVDDFHFSQFHKFARIFFLMFFCLILFLDSNSKALFLGYVRAQENDLPFPKKSKTLRETGTALLQGFVSPLTLFKNRNWYNFKSNPLILKV